MMHLTGTIVSVFFALYETKKYRQLGTAPHKWDRIKNTFVRLLVVGIEAVTSSLIFVEFAVHYNS